MSSNWPNKEARESYEISQFIEHYKKFPHGRHFEMIRRGDCVKSGPDCLVKDSTTQELFGVELTSVYNDDKSVPTAHIKQLTEPEPIRYNQEQINKYLQRVKNTIATKIQAAKSNYDTSYPLILSVYINEYETIWITEKIWRSFIKQNDVFFDQIRPFSEIVLWPLPQPTESALSIKPSI